MASSLPPPDGTVRWEKWRSRFVRDEHDNLPQGSSVQMERVLANPTSVARIKASFDGIYAAETEVRQILNAAGVSTIQYPYYLAFVVALLIATRLYYRRRFGIVYPKLA